MAADVTSVRTQGIRKFCQYTDDFVCSRSKLPGYEDTGYCNICREILEFVKVSLAHEMYLLEQFI